MTPPGAPAQTAPVSAAAHLVTAISGVIALWKHPAGPARRPAP